MAQAQTKNVQNESKTILICDDEKDIVDISKRILNWAGYKTITCSDGQELLENVKKLHDKIDLILLDVRMPVLDGHRTLEILKATNEFKKIPVVLFTVGVCNKDIQKGRELGADAYLPKPFSARGLLTYIQDILNNLN